jgi:hypothetical protein
LQIDDAAFVKGPQKQHNSLGDALKICAETLELPATRYATARKYRSDHFVTPPGD